MGDIGGFGNTGPDPFGMSVRAPGQARPRPDCSAGLPFWLPMFSHHPGIEGLRLAMDLDAIPL